MWPCANPGEGRNDLHGSMYTVSQSIGQGFILGRTVHIYDGWPIHFMMGGPLIL